jgi:hypothetical protein
MNSMDDDVCSEGIGLPDRRMSCRPAGIFRRPTLFFRLHLRRQAAQPGTQRSLRAWPPADRSRTQGWRSRSRRVVHLEYASRSIPRRRPRPTGRPFRAAKILGHAVSRFDFFVVFRGWRMRSRALSPILKEAKQEYAVLLRMYGFVGPKGA